MDHQHAFRQPVIFFKKFLSQWLHCSGKLGRVVNGSWSGASGGPRNSWFWVFVYLFNVSLQCGEKNLEAGAAGEGDKWQKGLKEILPKCPPPPPGWPPLYLTSSSPPSPTHHNHSPSSPPHPPPAPPLYGGFESLQALRALHQGPVGQALASSSPRFKILTSFKLFTSYLPNNYGYHKTLIFRSL